MICSVMWLVIQEMAPYPQKSQAMHSQLSSVGNTDTSASDFTHKSRLNLHFVYLSARPFCND